MEGQEVGPDELQFEVGSGNVFADLGLPDAEELLAKAKVLLEIREIIRKRKLSQRKLAVILGTEQARVSDLARGKFGGYSLDRLLAYLVKLDRDVEIVIREKNRKEARPAQITVTTRKARKSARTSATETYAS